MPTRKSNLFTSYSNIHMLPFFNVAATTGMDRAHHFPTTSFIVHIIIHLANRSWPIVYSDLEWFIKHGRGKKMYFDEVIYRMS